MILLLFLWSAPAFAITNGTGEIVWDNTLPAGTTVQLEYQSFLNAAWLPYTYPEPTVKADGKVHALVSFPPFPPDLRTDHYMCARAQASRSGQVAMANPSCVQVPVPALQPQPPVAEHGLKIVSQTPTQIVIEASKTDCPKVTTSTTGSTGTTQKRTVVCTK